MFACIFAPDLNAEMSLADFACRFSPLVEETQPNIVVIDVDGCEVLFGSAYQLATEIVQQSKQSKRDGGLDSKVNVALAANPDAALHVAVCLQGITFVAPNEELTCLGEFPLEALHYGLVDVDQKRSEEICETLKLWGVRTFHDFAALPITGVSELWVLKAFAFNNSRVEKRNDISS